MHRHHMSAMDGARAEDQLKHTPEWAYLASDLCWDIDMLQTTLAFGRSDMNRPQGRAGLQGEGANCWDVQVPRLSRAWGRWYMH